MKRIEKDSFTAKDAKGVEVKDEMKEEIPDLSLSLRIPYLCVARVKFKIW